MTRSGTGGGGMLFPLLQTTSGMNSRAQREASATWFSPRARAVLERGPQMVGQELIKPVVTGKKSAVHRGLLNPQLSVQEAFGRPSVTERSRGQFWSPNKSFRSRFRTRWKQRRSFPPVGTRVERDGQGQECPDLTLLCLEVA